MAKGGTMQNLMQKAIEKRMADKLGGAESNKGPLSNLKNSPELLRKGITNTVDSIKDGSLMRNQFNKAVEPARLTKNIFTDKTRKPGASAYDLYEYQLDKKRGNSRSNFANLADNSQLVKDEDTEEIINESLLNHYNVLGERTDQPLTKTEDILNLEDVQNKLADIEIEKVHRKFKLKKRDF
jgi:hypothetical protein